MVGKELNTEAARLYAGQDLTLQGSEVNLNATYASHNQHTEQESTQKGFSVGVTYNPIQAAKSAYDNAKQNGQFTNTAVGKIMGTADAGARAGLALTPIVVEAGSSRTQQQQDTVSREAIRTEAQAGSNLNIIATESDIRTQGAKLSAEGDALLQAQRDIQLDVTQNNTIQTGEQNRKGWSIDTRQIGVVGTHKQNENADLHTTTAKGTELSVGGKATLLAQTGNISVRGSSVVSQQDLVLNAAQNVSLESAQNTQNQINQKTSKGIGSAQISDTEQFFGYMNNQNRQTSDTVEQVRSQVGSLSGNVRG